MVRGGQDNRKFRNIRRKKKARKSFPVPRQGQYNVDSHEIIDEDIITEGEEVIIVSLEDEDTLIMEAEQVIEPSVNKTVTQEKVCQIEEENYYRFFDLSLLSIVFEHLGCPKCQSVFLYCIVKFFQLNFLDTATYFKINKFPQLEIYKTYT